MARFNPETYDPVSDSSASVSQPGKLVIFRQDGHCQCGCAQPVTNAKSKFRMGHDARFKGALTRAHLAAVPVVLSFPDEQTERTALAIAKLYDSPKFSWSDALRAAKERQGTAPAPKTPKAPAGPKVGDLRLVKVGRWEYEGKIVAINGTELEVEYTTAKGDTKTATVAA